MQEIPYFCEEFLNYMKFVKNKSDNTIKNYRNDFKLIFDYIKQDRKINDITIEVLKTITEDEYYKFLSQYNNLSTRNRRICTLKSLAKWFKKTKSIILNGVIQLETATLGESQAHFLEIDEVFALEKAAEETYDPLRNKAIIVVLANTGLRISELASLNIDTIKNNKATIIGKGNKMRVVPFNEKAMEAINEYKKQRCNNKSDALFINNRGDRISTYAIESMIKNAMNKVGIDSSIYSAHSLRHTFATQFLMQGASLKEVKDMLGHKDFKTTEIYAKMTVQQLQKKISDFCV